MGRCREMYGDVRRYGEIQGDVAVARDLAIGIAARHDPVGEHLRGREERAGAHLVRVRVRLRVRVSSL